MVNLLDLFLALKQMYIERDVHISTVQYCGYGTSVDRMINDMDISNKLLRKLDHAAWNAAYRELEWRDSLN